MGATKLFHKVFTLKQPPAIIQYISQSMINVDGARLVRHNNIKRVSKSLKTNKSLFYRATAIYNSLTIELKVLDHKRFNKSIKNIIRKNYSPDRVP